MTEFMTMEANSVCFECGEPVIANIPLIVDLDKQPALAELLDIDALYQCVCPKGHESRFTIRPEPPLIIINFQTNTPFLYGASFENPYQDFELLQSAVSNIRHVLGSKWNNAWMDKKIPHVPRHFLKLALTQGLEAVYKEIEQELDSNLRHFSHYLEFLKPALRYIEALHYYTKQKDESALTHAIDVIEFIINHPNYRYLSSAFQAEVLNNTGIAYKYLYEARGSIDALNRSVDCFEKAVRL